MEARQMTPELAYAFGIIGGDGTFSEKENRISVTDECYRFHEIVLKPLFEKLFDKKVSIEKMTTKKHNTTFRTRFCSNEAIQIFKSFGMPSKDKTFTVRTPEIIFSSSAEIQSEYIKGWMDAESWISTKKTIRATKSYSYPRIAFQVANEKIRDELVKLLQGLGINLSLWKYKNMRGFQIVGFEKVDIYLSKIGFRHPNKLIQIHNLAGRGPNASYNA